MMLTQVQANAEDTQIAAIVAIGQTAHAIFIGFDPSGEQIEIQLADRHVSPPARMVRQTLFYRSASCRTASFLKTIVLIGRRKFNEQRSYQTLE